MRLNNLHNLSLNSALYEEEDGEKKSEMEKKKVRDDEKSSVKRAYNNSGQTQQDIADKVGVDPSTISRIKSKKKDVERDPSIDTLKKIVKATGASAGDIIPGL